MARLDPEPPENGTAAPAPPERTRTEAQRRQQLQLIADELGERCSGEDAPNKPVLGKPVPDLPEIDSTPAA